MKICGGCCFYKCMMEFFCEHLVICAICWVQSAKLHLCFIIIIFINMNVSGDSHGSDRPWEMIFTIPSSHIYYPLLSAFKQSWIMSSGTLMPLEKAIDGFERNLFGTSALLSVFSSRKKERMGSLCISPLLFSSLGFSLFHLPLLCPGESLLFCWIFHTLQYLSSHSPDKHPPSPALEFRK